MHIVQEITSRLSIKRQIQRPVAELGKEIAQKHQEKLVRQTAFQWDFFSNLCMI